MIKTLTNTNNYFVNTFVFLVILFIAVTLICVSIEAFSDLDKLNRAY